MYFCTNCGKCKKEEKTYRVEKDNKPKKITVLEDKTEETVKVRDK